MRGLGVDHGVDGEGEWTGLLLLSSTTIGFSVVVTFASGFVAGVVVSCGSSGSVFSDSLGTESPNPLHESQTGLEELGYSGGDLCSMLEADKDTERNTGTAVSTN